MNKIDTSPLANPFEHFFQISKPECQSLFADFAVDFESLHDTLTLIENAKSPRIATGILSTISNVFGFPKFYFSNDRFKDSDKLEVRSYVERRLHYFYWCRVFELFDIATLSIDANYFNLAPYTFTYSDKPLAPFNPENVVKLLSGVKDLYSDDAILKTFSELKNVMNVKTFKNGSCEILFDYSAYSSPLVNKAINHLCNYLVIFGNPEWYKQPWYKQPLDCAYYQPDSMEKCGLVRIHYSSKSGEKLKLSKPMVAALQVLYDKIAETA